HPRPEVQVPRPPLELPPVKADLEFRQALRASEVALVKSWVLWTGVALGTRLLRLGLWRAVAMVIWFAAALAGTWLLVYGLTGHWWFAVAALLGPVPSPILWGRPGPAGLVAGSWFWPVLFGSLPGLLAYQVYRGIEWLAQLACEGVAGTRGGGVPGAAP